MITLVIDVTGRGILLAAGGLTLSLFIFMWLIKSTKNSHFARQKVFGWTGPFFNLGLVISIGLSALALGWTQYDYQGKSFVLDLEPVEDLLITPPPTSFPKPPPPPPPPPVVEPVPDEELLDKEPVKFEDMTLDADTPIERPEPAVAKPVMPSLPPPKEEEDKVPPIFVVVEEMPLFPGCSDLPGKKERQACSDKALLGFMYNYLKYPAPARENGVEGVAVVRFVVEPDGSISGATIVKDPGAGLGPEALRVVNLMNEKNIIWKPGKQLAKPVRVQFNLPVKFTLEK